MTLSEAYEKQRRERLELERKNRKLEAAIEEYDKGTYVSSEKASHLKQISKLTWENARLKNERDRYKAYWKNQVSITENYRVRADDAEMERDDVVGERDFYKKRCEELEERISVILRTGNEENRELRARVTALTNALEKELAKAANDSTNSSIPTSQTAYGRKKRIPNTRVRTGRSRGAQEGHEKHSLSPAADEGIAEYEDHTLSFCPDCGSDDLILVDKKQKCVLDYEIVRKTTYHTFWVYQCLSCGHTVHSPIPLHLKESAQYGPNIQTLGLALMNEGYVSINRTDRLMNGLIGNGIRLSEGYLCKLQKRAAAALSGFCEDVRLSCIGSPVVHWDDTVIFVNTARACMRFYGNDRLALFVAHKKKDRNGIDEDGILGALGPETTVVHDHVTMNYNADFHFTNAECAQHLIRELQKVYDISRHSWALQLKELISHTIHERNELVSAGATAFEPEKLLCFRKAVDSLLEKAASEHTEAIGRYYEADEKNLIDRLGRYKDSHLLWAQDFSVPPTNNLAERALRGQKVKQKVSGQFLSVQSATCFAMIRTYIETCKRNGVELIDALSRLTSGDPYSLHELLSEV